MVTSWAIVILPPVTGETAGVAVVMSYLNVPPTGV